ncbi:unnamed protein product [Symbiodinium sp. CCMP2592]|nr:unnamed protein product [Symbiodinium sp. CCMP2592]
MSFSPEILFKAGQDSAALRVSAAVQAQQAGPAMSALSGCGLADVVTSHRIVCPRSGGLPLLLLPVLEFWHADVYRAHHAGKCLASWHVLVMRFSFTKAERRPHDRLGFPGIAELQATKSQWQLTMRDGLEPDNSFRKQSPFDDASERASQILPLSHSSTALAQSDQRFDVLRGQPVAVGGLRGLEPAMLAIGVGISSGLPQEVEVEAEERLRTLRPRSLGLGGLAYNMEAGCSAAVQAQQTGGCADGISLSVSLPLALLMLFFPPLAVSPAGQDSAALPVSAAVQAQQAGPAMSALSGCGLADVVTRTCRRHLLETASSVLDPVAFPSFCFRCLSSGMPTYGAHHAGKSLASWHVLVMRFSFTKAERRPHDRLGFPGMAELQAANSQAQSWLAGKTGRTVACLRA